LGDHPDVPTILNNLAQCYFNMKRYRAARRTLRAAEQLSKSLDQRRTFGLSQILLGELDEIDNKPELAAQRWKEVAESAKELNDRELRFKAEYVLFRQALSLGNIPAARSIERRLRRLAPWMAPDLEEVRLFRELASSAQERMRA
jgi:tetratricopeptide (TPR) repeat protein